MSGVTVYNCVFVFGGCGGSSVGVALISISFLRGAYVVCVCVCADRCARLVLVRFFTEQNMTQKRLCHAAKELCVRLEARARNFGSAFNGMLFYRTLPTGTIPTIFFSLDVAQWAVSVQGEHWARDTKWASVDVFWLIVFQSCRCDVWHECILKSMRKILANEVTRAKWMAKVTATSSQSQQWGNGNYCEPYPRFYGNRTERTRIQCVKHHTKHNKFESMCEREMVLALILDPDPDCFPCTMKWGQRNSHCAMRTFIA